MCYLLDFAFICDEFNCHASFFIPNLANSANSDLRPTQTLGFRFRTNRPAVVMEKKPPKLQPNLEINQKKKFRAVKLLLLSESLQAIFQM